ncbi:hypothetical protein MJO28_005892 [Puccinia striiformis f. sp. tritici]|uniref:Uncharacterized protein n=1 Tax=Puccinia striiformis f. sp. tritici TaxID=168172 RepID=A0ACC0EG08_9BASI|nr:hypothetical protein Pst134EB_012086 [Puccinia striiformis f. sp. tritici]KAI7953345.1 hypothetical protein MJO28_005892 [Puccinia striiformis f. sp. tritici]
MVVLLSISNSPAACAGAHTNLNIARADLLPRTPTQLSTGAVIAPRSPMPKKKGGEGRGGRGGRPGTGGHEDGRGGRGFGTVGGGGGVGDPRLTGQRPGTVAGQLGVKGGRGDRGRGSQAGGEPRPTHRQGSAQSTGDGNGGRIGVPGSRGRCPDGRRRVNGQCPTS